MAFQRITRACVSGVCRNFKRNTHHQHDSVKIVEVGPRDGLQNEPNIVPAQIKIDFINKLSGTGVKYIEVASFVSPKWVPQMADNKEVYAGIDKHSDITYAVLVPNLEGLKNALESDVKEIALFGSASEGFARKNTNCSIQETLDRAKEVATEAIKKGVKVRGYVSCTVGCPYDGQIKPSVVARVTEELFKYGCYEVSLGDTIGVGTRLNMQKMLQEVTKVADPKLLAIHCHDTYGQGLANVCVALEHGIRTVDSSVSGLGGCPYAKGAAGNVATEDVIYLLHGWGMSTGVDLNAMVQVGQYISNYLKKPTDSRVNKALFKKLS